MTLIRLTCDCGAEYVLGVNATEDEEVDETAVPLDPAHAKEADYVPKPALEVDATPSYENPDDPFWAPDASEENETRIHEADPIELRPRPRTAPDIPTRKGRAPIGFTRLK